MKFTKNKSFSRHSKPGWSCCAGSEVLETEPPQWTELRVFMLGSLIVAVRRSHKCGVTGTKAHPNSLMNYFSFLAFFLFPLSSCFHFFVMKLGDAAAERFPSECKQCPWSRWRTSHPQEHVPGVCLVGGFCKHQLRESASSSGRWHEGHQRVSPMSLFGSGVSSSCCVSHTAEELHTTDSCLFCKHGGRVCVFRFAGRARPITDTYTHTHTYTHHHPKCPVTSFLVWPTRDSTGISLVLKKYYSIINTT